MSRIISIINQKGGVGKSTTADALSNGLALQGYKVLAIDMDSQANLSYALGASLEGASILGILTGEVKTEDAIKHCSNIDVISASRLLSGADSFFTDSRKEYRLKDSIEALRGKYDYIVIDTPPTLGILTVNALTASDSVVIPSQADIYSLQGIEQLYSTIQPVKKYRNESLKIDGILLTRFTSRSVLSREIASLAEKVAERMNTRLFRTTIRDAVAVKEAQLKRTSLYSYAPRAKVTADYRAFTEELLETYKEEETR